MDRLRAQLGRPQMTAPLRLTLLAPEIIEAIMEGRQPAGDLPLIFHPARTRVSALVVTPFGAV